MSDTTVLSTIPGTPTASEAPAAGGETPAVATAAGGETPAVATAVEVAPQEPKEDPDLLIAQKLEAVTRREARARKLEGQWQTKFAELDSMKADLAKKQAEMEAFFEDPVSWALKNGKDPVDVVRRATKPMSEEEKRLAKLEERLQKDDEERKKASEESSKREQHLAEQRNWQSFVREITPEEYPHLTSLYEASDVPKLVLGMLNRPHDPTDPESPTVREVFRERYRRDPTPKEIRESLEHEAEMRAMKIIELRGQKLAPSQATPATPTAKQESTSLSNQHAASSPSAKVGTESREERMKRLKEELEAEASATE